MPTQSEAQLRARSLAVEGLAEFVRVETGTADLAWPPTQLTPEVLTAIAWFFSTDLEVARAKAETAAAGIVTARQRINPSLTGGGGRNKTPDSIATYSISTSFTIETAGKRGLRILEAEKVAEAARIGVYEVAWEVRVRMRNALSGYLVAKARLAAVEAEDKLRGEVSSILQRRLELGEAARPELNQAAAERASVTNTLRTAEGDVAEALGAIAAAAGLPVSAIERRPLELSSMTGSSEVAAEQVRRAGLLHRADIRKALVEYEAVDTRLRLAIANQYPNIVLAPDLTMEEGSGQYTLGSILDSLPIFHKHQGPIAEGEAARKQAGAEFLALQAKVIAAAEGAALEYRSALLEWQTAGAALQRVSRQKTASAEAALLSGDASRLDVTLASLDTVLLRHSSDDAFERLQAALGALEDAMQTPVWAAIPAPRAEKTR